MTYIEAIGALLIFSFFLAGFGRAALPAARAFSYARAEYLEAKALEFASQSFKMECRKPAKERDLEKWKKILSEDPRIDRYDVQVIRDRGDTQVLQLACVIGGERFEILGLCGP
jgi:hypothetical protein